MIATIKLWWFFNGQTLKKNKIDEISSYHSKWYPKFIATFSAKGPWNNTIFPIRYVILKSFKAGHWLSQSIWNKHIWEIHLEITPTLPESNSELTPENKHHNPTKEMNHLLQPLELSGANIRC